MGGGPTVCVTGASGFIGSHIVKQLLQKVYSVKGTVRDASNEEKYGWLKELEEGTPGKLELVSADLMEEGSFDKAVEGCELVCHVAANATLTAKDPRKDIVDPALDGTRNVFASILKAQTARRVVYTSSVAAIKEDFAPSGTTFTEADWHRSLSLSSPYPMGKTLAEKYAWKVYEDQKKKSEKEGGWSFELVVINPALTLGELLHRSQVKSSMEFMLAAMNGTMTLAPDFYNNVVHVHDVALAHVLALENPKAHGRYIMSEDGCTSVLELCRTIKEEFPQVVVPTMQMPTYLLYAFAFGIPHLSFEVARRRAGYVYYYSPRKAKVELGIRFISPRQAIIDAARSLISLGLVQL